MNLILGHVGHSGIPLANQINVLVDLVGLDLVENDAVDVLASREDLTKAALDLLVHLTTLLGAVDEVGEAAALLAGCIFCLFARFAFCQHQRN